MQPLERGGLPSLMLTHPITLSFEQVVRLTMILTDHTKTYRGMLTTEADIYRYMLARKLIKQLRSKSVTMDHARKLRAKITFGLDEVVLIHRVLRKMDYGEQWQPILSAFDQAQVNMLPVLIVPDT